MSSGSSGHLWIHKLRSCALILQCLYQSIPSLRWHCGCGCGCGCRIQRMFTKRERTSRTVSQGSRFSFVHSLLFTCYHCRLEKIIMQISLSALLIIVLGITNYFHTICQILDCSLVLKSVMEEHLVTRCLQGLYQATKKLMNTLYSVQANNALSMGHQFVSSSISYKV
jgi:hypothetical protein